ncbi:MAG: 23S rRNA (guanosine(2251)-2'-O)-methyltransferase RlmB [Myxococcota bacterium]
MTEGKSLVYGVQPVMEALRDPSQVERVHLSRQRTGATLDIERAAKSAGVRLRLVPREALERLAGGQRHQGVVAELRSGRIEPSTLEDVISRARAAPSPLLVLLDGIQDPGNLGAILRSAYALGAHGVVVPQDRSAGLGPAAVKASAGAALHVPVAQVVNLKHALEPLTASGFWTAAAVMDGEPAPSVDLDRPLALVVGGEAKGVRPSLARRCDIRLSIPMAERGFDSLNASVAAGILLYEVGRQRRFGLSAKRVDR